MTVKEQKDTFYLLTESITERSVKDLLDFICTSVDDSCERLHLLINSQGGEVALALALARMLLSLPCEVITYNLANVDSAAILIFVAGAKRLCLSKSRFFFHPPTKQINGSKTARELILLAREIHLDALRIANYLEERTKTSKQIWLKKMKLNTHLGICDAYDLGLITSLENCQIPLNWNSYAYGRDGVCPYE